MKKTGKKMIGVVALESKGWAKVGVPDLTEFAEFKIYTSPDSAMTMKVRRSLAKPNLAFLPAEVQSSEGKTLWSYASEGGKGIAHIVVADGVLVIAFTDWGTIRRVIPVEDLPKIKTVKVGEEIKVIGGRGLREMINLKHAAGEVLGMKVDITDAEKAFLAKFREVEESREAEQRKLREAANKERAEKIMSLPSVSGYTADSGQLRYGPPVLKDEWPMLEVGTPVVLVEERTEDGSPVGDIAEAFRVGRGKGGRPEKVGAKEIRLRGSNTSKKEVKKATAAPKTTLNTCEEILFEVPEDKAEELKLTAGPNEATLTDQAGLSALMGLNSGTLVAIPASDDSCRVQVERMLGSKGSQTLGLFKKL